MKIRNGFVSNSSSSSFIIDKKKLTEKQIKMIFNHKFQIIKDNKHTSEKYYSYDYWTIDDNCKYYDDDRVYARAYTIMDNFDLINYCIDVVGVDEEDIEVVGW
jgi:NADPH-dependent ferric siderophore reductase